MRSRQHSLEAAARQKRAVASLVAETFDERLIVEHAHDVADSNVARIARQAHAALRAAHTLQKSVRGQMLKHLRHVMTRNPMVIRNDGRTEDLGVAIREKNEGAQAEIGEIGQTHDRLLITVFQILK